MGRYTVTEMHEVDLATLKAENAAAEVAQQAAILWKRMQQPTASVQRGGKSKRSSGGGHGTSRGSTGKGRGGPGASSSSSSSSTCPTAVGMASVLGPSSDSFGCDDCSASEGDISCDSETQEALEDWRRAACIEELQAKLSGHTAELERLDNLSGSLVDNVERNDKSFPRGHVTRPGRLRRGANWGPWHIAPIFSKRSRGQIIAYGCVCGCHVNKGEESRRLQCKKYLSLGTTTKNKITESEARRLVKIWLVFGRHVLPSDTERSDHVRFNPRSFGEDLLESDLDALVSCM